jgi:hypothetical protein
LYGGINIVLDFQFYEIIVCFYLYLFCVVLWATHRMPLCPWNRTWNTSISTPAWRGPGVGISSRNREHCNDSRTWRSSKTGVWEFDRILQTYGRSKRLFGGKAEGISLNQTKSSTFSNISFSCKYMLLY